MQKISVALFLTFLIFHLTGILIAQVPFRTEASNYTLIHSTESPFWLMANRSGEIATNNNIFNVTTIAINKDLPETNKHKIHTCYGGKLVAGVGKKSYFQINQLHAGFEYRKWKLQTGLFSDSILLGGLSSTNGNIARSLNARPYPKIMFSTHNFIPVPFTNNRLRFSAAYDEGILNDNRYVHRTHLHHKSLYLKTYLPAGFRFTIGLEDYVMWGGLSPSADVGQMPESLKAYFTYITGGTGTEEFPLTDQQNVAGNHYGTYNFFVEKTIGGTDITFVLNHPFEDFSGVNWRNWSDNLYGIHLSFGNKRAIVTQILYEFTDLRQQGIVDSTHRWDEKEQRWFLIHHDNYFNHAVYQSGVTYHQRSMATPFLEPVWIVDGISKGFKHTRFYAHHFGAKGHISKNLQWKSLLSYVYNIGSYSDYFIEPKRQFHGLAELSYYSSSIPFQIALSAACDIGELTGNHTGLQFSLFKSW